MLLHLLFRQATRFKRPMLELPICQALRRLVLLRGSTPNLAATKLTALESAVCRHFVPCGQLPGDSSLLQSQQTRVADRLGALQYSVANGHNGDQTSMSGRRLGRTGASAPPLCACRLAGDRR